MRIVDIGKGKRRINVRSKRKRERLSRIKGVIIDGDRVIFPAWMTHDICKIVSPDPRRRKTKPEQTSLFAH